jgi:YD repeat-containing protein
VLATNKLTPSAVAYTAAGQLLSWQEGSINLNRSYDGNRGWMTGVTVQSAGNSIVSQDYFYNPTGQLTTATDNVNGGLTASYGYDYLGRLTAASTPNWGLQWAYDDFGNRLTQTATSGAPPVSSLSYDVTSNRITTPGYSYDNNGDLTMMPGTASVSVANAGFESGNLNFLDGVGRSRRGDDVGGPQRQLFGCPDPVRRPGRVSTRTSAAWFPASSTWPPAGCW